MTSSRYLLALLAATAISGSVAFAAPPISVGGGVGAHGGIGVGGPPMGVPPAHVPVIGAPPVSVPKPQGSAVPPANANANAQLHANASLAAGDVVHGTVTAVNGTAVTVHLSNGTAQTYTVSAQTAARLQSFLDKTIAFRLHGGTFDLVGQGTPPLHGTLVSVAGTIATVKLANGTTQTYTVTAQQAAWLQMHAGKRIVFWNQTNGTIELNQSSHASSVAQKPSKRKAPRGRGHIH